MYKFVTWDKTNAEMHALFLYNIHQNQSQIKNQIINNGS